DRPAELPAVLLRGDDRATDAGEDRVRGGDHHGEVIDERAVPIPDQMPSRRHGTTVPRPPPPLPRSRMSRSSSTRNQLCSRPSSSTTGPRPPYSNASSGSPSTSTSTHDTPVACRTRSSASRAYSHRWHRGRPSSVILGSATVAESGTPARPGLRPAEPARRVRAYRRAPRRSDPPARYSRG